MPAWPWHRRHKAAQHRQSLGSMKLHKVMNNRVMKEWCTKVDSNINSVKLYQIGSVCTKLNLQDKLKCSHIKSQHNNKGNPTKVKKGERMIENTSSYCTLFQ